MSEGRFGGVVARLEARLVAACALAPRPLPPALEVMTGTWRGTPVTMTTRAFAGPAVAYARCVRLAGGALDIGNVLALPRRRGTVLGIDLVGLGRPTALVAADASPVAGAAPLGFAPPALPPAGELPAWAARWFSADALFARVAPAQVPADWLVALAGAWAASLSAEGPEAAADLDAYMRDHREGDATLGMLAHLFGAGPAGRYLVEVMFPAAEVWA